MSKPWTPQQPRTAVPSNRGGAPVGMLSELPPLERAAILGMRRWCDGPSAREALAAEFALAFDAERVKHELSGLAELMSLLVQGRRRAIMRHDCDCACFGGDESAFAHMVAASTAGEREDAMAFALTLMNPDAAWQAVLQAESFGLALLAIGRFGHMRSAPYTCH